MTPAVLLALVLGLAAAYQGASGYVIQTSKTDKRIQAVATISMFTAGVSAEMAFRIAI